MTSYSVTSKRKNERKFVPYMKTYDSKLFLSDFHEDRYIVNFGRQIIGDRRFELRESQYDTIRNEINRRRWQEYASYPLVFNEELVREFYANAYPKEHNEQSMMSWVRGSRILFTEKSINVYLGTTLTATEDQNYTERLFKGEPNINVIEETICSDGNRFKRNLRRKPIHAKRTHLCTLAQAWAVFVLCNLSPSSHTSAVVVDRAKLLVAIIKGWSINVGRIIMKELATAVMGGPNTPLIFPCLITELCRAQGIDVFEPRCALVPTCDPINKRYLDRNCCGGPSYLDADESSQSEDTPFETASPSDPPIDDAIRDDIVKMGKKLKRIEEKVDCILVRMEFMTPHMKPRDESGSSGREAAD